MRRLTLLILTVFPLVLQAQWPDTSGCESDWEAEVERQVGESLERYAEEGGAEWDAAERQQALEALRLNPVNIHQAEESVLCGLLGLTAFQYYHLRRYADLHGPVQGPHELAAVEGFDPDVVRRIQPYLLFGAPEVRRRLRLKDLSNGKTECLARWGRVLERQEGMGRVPDSLREAYPGRYYEGGPDYLLLKCQYRCGDMFHAGVTLEKDVGESFFRASNRQGFDFSSFHLRYRGDGVLRQSFIGDYQVQFGQGLAMGMGFQMQPSGPDGVKSEAYGLKAHTSANESQFLRGGAVRLRLSRRAGAALYGSFRRTDARSGDSAFSLAVSGLHRSLAETEGEKTLGEWVGGGYFYRDGNIFHLGAGLCAVRYDGLLAMDGKPYKLFRFNGSQLWNGSLDFQCNLHRLHLFGEFVRSGCGSSAFVGGLLFPADDRLQFSAQLRLLPKDFQSVSDLLCASSGLSDEQSLQLRGRLLVGKRGEFDMAWTERRFPWLKYRTDAPSRASGLRLRYAVSERVGAAWLCMYGWSRSERNLTVGMLRTLSAEQRHSMRLQWTWQPVGKWQFRIRWDAALYSWDGRRSYGGMCTQQVTCRLERVQWCAFLACFDTDEYDAAIYFSEPDVRYAVSSVTCSGRGIRAGGVFSLRLSPALTWYLKVSVFRYDDRSVVGSGPALIAAPHKSEIRLQCIWKL